MLNFPDLLQASRECPLTQDLLQTSGEPGGPPPAKNLLQTGRERNAVPCLLQTRAIRLK